VLASYEKARIEALKDPTKLKAALVAATKLPDTVIQRQLERTNLTYSVIGDAQRETIEAAGLALQKADVIKADVDVVKTVSSLVDPSYASAALGQ
jgi:sulfonate transport system substrate-binding protein